GKPGSYRLRVSKNGIRLTASTPEGIFNGVQTLLQLIPMGRNGLFKTRGPFKLPCVEITDEPRFEWRGMHLDVCRHFFDKQFIKKYIDYLAMHKMNVFHWHLTEDQGWRIEIKKYPELTRVGAWRNGSMVGPYNDHNTDTVLYGGYYSQKDIREIVKYASARHITIVPEVEMPGHSLAALASYPELSCTGGPFDVAKEWGVFDDVYCAGNDKTFEFLQGVLDEVCDLFPGKYIHIGGDECPKTRWKTCEKCQKRIKETNLKDEHELQSYFIQRIEKYLNAKGKQIIGWDEILEGGLAPNAAVMSWRGTERGIAAAKAKHFVVMTPGSHCYFDHYQGNPEYEPHAIGGFTPLEKVYAYDPVPAELNVEEASYIMGAQGNVWTEYINFPKEVEYMALPRMCALAEVLWTYPQNKNGAGFVERLNQHLDGPISILCNYSRTHQLVNFILSPASEGVDVTVYTLDSTRTIFAHANTISPNGLLHTDTTIFKAKKTGTMHMVKKPMVLNAYSEKRNEKGLIQNRSKHTSIELYVSKSTSKNITFTTDPDPKYKGNGSFTLVDAVRGSKRRQNHQWLAWQGKDVEMTIDLEKKQKLKEIKVGSYQDESNWIYRAQDIALLISKNGKDYTKINTLSKHGGNGGPYRESYQFKFHSKKARYIKIIAQNPGTIPEGKPGAGNPSWLFFDEIEVY
ncbi:MAG TPA: family 20 glycosylhydrolase, partial [Flavobacteriales bacterium]|nr:family 20 glycosylhydrolase [Flavobacteriales bacterium]